LDSFATNRFHLYVAVSDGHHPHRVSNDEYEKQIYNSYREINGKESEM